MALNAVRNQRLESPDLLLLNLISTVQVILDLSPCQISIFSNTFLLQRLVSNTKQILKHGAKIHHHLIVSQPSYSGLDAWLEKSFLDHTIVKGLVSKLSNKTLRQSYYNWSLLRNYQKRTTFYELLEILFTRNLERLNELSISNFNLTETKEGVATPIFDVSAFSSTGIKMITEEDSVANTMELSHPIKILLSPIPSTTVVSEAELKEGEVVQSSIPPFSYSYGSPILSVPDFSQFEDTPQLDPMRSCFRSHKSANDDTEDGNLTLSQQNPNFSSLSCIASSPKSKSFLESDGVLPPPAFGNHFPLPAKGQSLKHFLSSLSDLSQPELDRENSHFNVSEALISAFESMKVKARLDELQEQRHFERMEAMFGTCSTTRRFSTNSLTKSRRKLTLRHRPNLPVTETEESEFEFWRQNRHPPPEIKKKPRKSTLKLVGSDGRSESQLSTTDALATTSGSNSLSSSSEELNYSTAENVALSLLRNVKLEDGSIPEASSLQWLVNESDCPQQQLLPLPKNWNSQTSSSSDELEWEKRIRLRGTIEWAPPRPQIIFTIHPPPNLQRLMEIQKYRCAGCGVRVQQKYASTYRFCYYLGRYFCSGCHSKKSFRLPQMILHRWDFSQYQVSNFSASLLESLRFDPVYNIVGINPVLAKKGRVAVFRNLRIQLRFVRDYLSNCRGDPDLTSDLISFPSYYTSDPDLFSLEDLIQLRYGIGRPLKIKETVTKAIHHVLNCHLCRQLGFHCELCRNGEILFPFQLSKVNRCDICANCFHSNCFKAGLQDCPKCLRRSVRKQSLASSSEASF